MMVKLKKEDKQMMLLVGVFVAIYLLTRSELDLDTYTLVGGALILFGAYWFWERGPDKGLIRR